MLLLFPLLVFSDLNWSWFDPHLLSTCSMDQFIYIWDLRSEGGVDNIIGSRAGGGGGVGGMVGHVLRNTVRRGPQTLVDVFAITCDIEHKILPQDDSTTTY